MYEEFNMLNKIYRKYDISMCVFERINQSKSNIDSWKNIFDFVKTTDHFLILKEIFNNCMMYFSLISKRLPR